MNDNCKKKMKKIYVTIKFVVFVIMISVLQNCSQKKDCSEQINQIKQMYQDSLLSYQDSLAFLHTQLDMVNDQLNILKFPADQRLYEIQTLFAKQEYAEVKVKVLELKSIFPNAKEIEECDKLISTIETLEAAKKAEEERIKALGFKVFKDTPKVLYDDVTYSFSGFTYGRTFTYEYVYDVDEYSYEVADKDCTYILGSLTISTKKNYAYPQSTAVYEIVDGKLHEISRFQINHASYNTYGASIGNYSETSHDFSKVSSVKFKMAAEIPLSKTKQPLLILMKTSNSTSSINLTLEDVKENYAVVKILNRNNLK